MLLKIPNWLKLIILIGVAVLAFALYRGCQSQRRIPSISVDYKNRLDNLVRDSVEAVSRAKEYISAMTLNEGLLELSRNKEISLTEDLRYANGRIEALLRNHIPIKPSPDTSITTVPNQFIEECNECFTELGNGQVLVIKYKSEKERQDKLVKELLAQKDKRISYLDSSRNVVISNYRSLIDSTRNVTEPARRLYFGGGVKRIGPLGIPNAIGGGFAYQDKRLRIFTLKYYGSSYGPIAEGEVFFPLSLKRRK